jgi:alkylation response protein AidB-like acyl-CoA dehydrogenase
MAYEISEQLTDSAIRMLSRRASKSAQATGGTARQSKANGASIEYGRMTPLGDSRSLWAEIGEAGWLGVMVGEERGGLGLGLREVLAIASAFGRFPREPALVLSATVMAALLDRLGEPGAQIRQRFLCGELMAGLAWQERLGALDGGPTGVSCEPAAAGALLSGKKVAVFPADSADGWLVTARSGNGTVLAWVDRSAPGVSVARDECVDDSDLGTIEFDCVQIAPECLFAVPEADASVARALDIGRMAQAAMLHGLADEALKQTLEYLRIRKQFGKPLGAFQALQHRAVDCYLKVLATRVCLDDAIEACSDVDLAATASRAKYRAGTAALKVCRDAVQFHGAIGTTDELQISGFLRRALMLNAWLGSPATHLRRYASNRAVRGTRKAEMTVAAPDIPLREQPDAQFRATVRAFLAEHFPAELKFLPRNAKWIEWKPWLSKLAERGWAAPAWPREFGGMGLSPAQQLALIEVQEEFGVPRSPADSSIGMLGPLLIRYGTKEQQERFLPGILTGETTWAQGYSEPNAGSDLASLSTRAEVKGDRFIVNGQKIWSSYAAEATHMFALVRTGPAQPKQAGISFLLVDMTTPGITVRPIRDMAGHDKFCEVFFDNVEVPLENLVGPLNGGWTLAKDLLGFERVTIGSPNHCRVALYQLESIGIESGLFDDPDFANEYAALELDVRDVGAVYEYFCDFVKRGEELPAAVSASKLIATETFQRVADSLVSASAENGLRVGVFSIGGSTVGTVGPYMNSVLSFIYAGTNDIQRNLIARQVLELPAQ